MNLCECGCGKECKRRFISGHNVRLMNPTPKKEQIQNLCKCGCEQLCNNKFVLGHNSRTKDNPFYIYKNTNPGWNLGKTKEKDGITSGRKKGSYLSENDKQNIRNGIKSFYNDPVGSAHARTAISKYNKGKTISEKTRIDISNSLLGHPVSEASKEANRRSHLGKIASIETIQKMSKSHKFFHQNLTDEAAKRLFVHSHPQQKYMYISNYNKVFFMRSNWEVLYAEHLDFQNIIWQYEPRQFKLSNGKRYFPDFYLPDLNEYHEVKGYMRPKDEEKMNLFRKDYPKETLIMIGSYNFDFNSAAKIKGKNK